MTLASQQGRFVVRPAGAQPGDAVQELPVAFERPQLSLRGTQRDWIVIPGREPGSYMVIEVDRVRTTPNRHSPRFLV